MKSLIAKYWNRLRFTEKDADRRLRGECISIASRFQSRNVADLLRASQMIYDWIEGAPPPAENLEAAE